MDENEDSTYSNECSNGSECLSVNREDSCTGMDSLECLGVSDREFGDENEDENEDVSMNVVMRM